MWIDLYTYSRCKQMELALRLNCGFARVAVKEFSGIRRGLSRSSINHQKRKEKFQLLFADVEKYCDLHEVVILVFVLDCFGKRWNQTRACVLNIVVHFLLLIGKLCHCLRKKNIPYFLIQTPPSNKCLPQINTSIQALQ